jgi:hypothetical protein
MVRKRSSKPEDEVQAAFEVMQRIIEKTETLPEPTAERQKDPAAVSLGRRGGLKGGPARAKALSAKRRREIARNAIAARWKKHK